MLDRAPSTTPLHPPSLGDGGVFFLLFWYPPHVSMTKRAQTMVGHRLGLGISIMQIYTNECVLF
jgi:hypothetical protein